MPHAAHMLDLLHHTCRRSRQTCWRHLESTSDIEPSVAAIVSALD